MLSITSSVGKGGKNLPKDIKVVQALLNVYKRKTKGAGLLSIDGKSTNKLESAIFDFQSKHLKMAKPDSRVDSGGKSFRQLKQVLASVFKPVAISAPDYGKVTWESEGSEGGPYHSRKLHVPSSVSGLTAGRGYDMKTKKASKICSDLTASGVDTKKAETLKGAAGLFGSAAETFIIEKDLLDFQISPESQVKLFKISYDMESDEVKRLCEKQDVVLAYGKVDWDNLDEKIKDITIDLKFRGDYTGSSRKMIQKSIVDNDLAEFKKILVDKSKWPDVPKDRFQRRKKYLEAGTKKSV